MDEAGNRVAHLRKLAGVMLGTSVREVEVRPGGGPYPVSWPDLFLARLPDARPVPAWLGGELRLRVLTHAWRVESRERAIAACYDPPSALRDAAGVLAGRAVTALRIGTPGLDTTIWFGDLRLRVFPVVSVPLPDGVPAWTLRTAAGVSLSVGPGGSWRIAGRRPRDPKDLEAGA